MRVLTMGVSRLAFAGALALWAPIVLSGADPIAGTIKTVQGTASVVRGTATLPAQEGMHLLENDTLRTQADGRLGVILQDGTRISLAPSTELHLDHFVYEPVEGKLDMLLRMLRGAAVFISGNIAKLSPESARVETPAGIAGLRGTRFAIALDQPPEKP